MKTGGRRERGEGREKSAEGRAQRPEISKWAFIALGANLGEPERTILEAMRRLQELSDEPLLRSSLRRTTPVDCPPGSPPFVNAVVGLLPRSGETPESLLAKLQSL